MITSSCHTIAIGWKCLVWNSWWKLGPKNPWLMVKFCDTYHGGGCGDALKTLYGMMILIISQINLEIRLEIQFSLAGPN